MERECKMSVWRSRILHFLRIATFTLALLFSQGLGFSSAHAHSRRPRQVNGCIAQAWNKAHYSRHDAQRMVIYSMATYSYGRDIDAWQCNPCRLIQPLSGLRRYDGALGTRAIVGYDMRLNSVVVAFRGVDNPKTAFGVFLYKLVPFKYGKGKVHAGIQKMYEDIRERILRGVNELLVRQLRMGVGIYVTGHSLGGALATLAAVDFPRRIRHRKITMYNFGSPRVGDNCFVQDYNNWVKRSIRVVNYRDPVPNWPLHTWGYRHVPRPVFYQGYHFKYLGIKKEVPRPEQMRGYERPWW